MLRKITVEGPLGEAVGRDHYLNVANPAEAIWALRANYPEFIEYVEGNPEDTYNVFLGDQALGLDELDMPGNEEIFIVPAVAGAGLKKALGIILVVIAVAIILVTPGLREAVLSGAALTGVQSVALSLSVALALQGVSMLLFGVPSLGEGQEEPPNKHFNGPVNTVGQGGSVPLLYGRMLVGSVVVGSGISTSRVNINASQGDEAVTPPFPIWKDGIAYFSETGRFELPENFWEEYTGFGSGRTTVWDWGRQTLNESNTSTSLQSNQFARVVDMLCEGEIKGLVDGAKSIYLDEVALINSLDEPNFEGVVTTMTTGTQDQGHLPGFSPVESTFQGPGAVTVSDPVAPVAISNAVPVDAVIINVYVSALFEQTKKGKLRPLNVQWAVDISENGGPYERRLVDTIYGQTTQRYDRSRRVELSGSGPWQVKVTRLTEDHDDTRKNSLLYWETYVTVADEKFRYPNTAVIGTQFDSSQFGSVPSRAYDLYGLVIEVPSNYFPETGTYTRNASTGADTGVYQPWDGTFYRAYSNNPAWVFYDLTVNKRYGLGDLLDVDAVSMTKWALYEIARYCDELVPNGKGGTERRFTCNAYIFQAEDAVVLIRSIASVFRGLSYWGVGSVLPIQDRPRPVSHIFHEDNIENGEFVYGGSSIAARHTAVQVTWNNPENFYRQEIELVESRTGIERYGYNMMETVAFGCTSQSQARRVGKAILVSELEETETVAFKTSNNLVMPGQRIAVMDRLRVLETLAGRIKSIVFSEPYVHDHFQYMVPEESQGSRRGPDPLFQTGWSLDAIIERVSNLEGGPVGPKGIRARDGVDTSRDLYSHSGGPATQFLPCDPALNYRIKVRARQPQGDRNNYLLVDFYNSAGSRINNTSSSDATGWELIGTNHYWGVSNAAFGADWTEYELLFGPDGAATLPTGAAYLRYGALLLRHGTQDTEVELQDYEFTGLWTPGDNAITFDDLHKGWRWDGSQAADALLSIHVPTDAGETVYITWEVEDLTAGQHGARVVSGGSGGPTGWKGGKGLYAESFTATDRAAVIAIAGDSSFKGLVQRVTVKTKDTITTYESTNILVGQEYTLISVGTDGIAREGRVLTGEGSHTVLDVTDAGSEHGKQWVLKRASLQPKIFTVVAIEEDSEEGAGEVLQVSALEHIESKYGFIDEDEPLEVPRTSVNSAREQLPPSAVTLQQQIYRRGNETLVGLSVDWQEAPGATRYFPQIQLKDGDWIPLGDPRNGVSSRYAEVQEQVPGSYRARVFAQNALGVRSAPKYTAWVDGPAGVDEPYSGQNLLSSDALGPNVTAGTNYVFAGFEDGTEGMPISLLGMEPGEQLSFSGMVANDGGARGTALFLRAYDSGGTLLGSVSTGSENGISPVAEELVAVEIVGWELPAGTVYLNAQTAQGGAGASTYLAVSKAMLVRGPSALPFEQPPARVGRGEIEEGAQVNAAGTLSLETNVSINGSANPGEAILTGMTNGKPDRTKDGYINWEGAKVTIPRTTAAVPSFTFFTGASRSLGHIVFDTAKTDPFFIDGGAGDPSISIAFARRDSTVPSGWVYDNNGSWIEFTPTDAMVSLGPMDAGGDVIYGASLWGSPIRLIDAPQARAGLWSSLLDDDGNKPEDGATVGATASQVDDIAAALTDAANAQATADGKIVTFFSASAPTAQVVGDLWLRSSDNRLFRWNGSSWVDSHDQEIDDAISAASGAQATADGKIVTFVGTTAPTADAVGDLWVHSTTRQVSRWSGSAWVPVTPANVDDDADVTAASPQPPSWLSALIAAGDIDAASVEVILTATNMLEGPAEAGADVTENHRSAGILSVDRRADNDPPSFYYAKGMGSYTEFKRRDTLGWPGGGTFVHLHTDVPWNATSGGVIIQRYEDLNGDTYHRRSTSTSAWGAWQFIESTANNTESRTSNNTDNVGVENVLTAEEAIQRAIAAISAGGDVNNVAGIDGDEIAGVRTSNTSFPTTTWYRVFTITASSGRGGGRFRFITTGGSDTPGLVEFGYAVDWSGGITLALLTRTATMSNNLRKVRITRTASAHHVDIEASSSMGDLRAAYWHGDGFTKPTLGGWASGAAAGTSSAIIDFTERPNAVLGFADSSQRGVNDHIANHNGDVYINGSLVVTKDNEAGAEKTTGKSLAILIDRVADNIDETAGRKWGADSGATLSDHARLSIFTNFGCPTSPTVIDDWDIDKSTPAFSIQMGPNSEEIEFDDAGSYLVTVMYRHEADDLGGFVTIDAEEKPSGGFWSEIAGSLGSSPSRTGTARGAGLVRFEVSAPNISHRIRIRGWREDLSASTATILADKTIMLIERLRN